MSTFLEKHQIEEPYQHVFSEPSEVPFNDSLEVDLFMESAIFYRLLEEASATGVDLVDFCGQKLCVKTLRFLEQILASCEGLFKAQFLRAEGYWAEAEVLRYRMEQLRRALESSEETMRKQDKYLSSCVSSLQD